MVWELGDGFGHLARLLPVASALEAAGHEVVWAVRSPVNAHTFLGAGRILQAPYVHPTWNPPRPGAKVSSLGDVLATVGYADPRVLGGTLASWDSLLDLVRPDLMVSDFAPTATLAARGRVRHVRIGDRFTLASADRPRFPPFRRTGASVPEEQLLAVVSEVQRRRGGPTPSTLPAAFRAERSFLCMSPELDYDPSADGPDLEHAGPIVDLPQPMSDPPAADWFAYLSATHPSTVAVLRALVSVRQTGVGYVRDASPPFLERFRSLGLELSPTPLSVEVHAGRARRVIHHGGHSTAELCLSLGRPQLVVPRHAEQALTGRALVRLGVGHCLSTDGVDEPALAELLLAPPPEARAREVGAERALRPGDGLRRVVASCLARTEEHADPSGHQSLSWSVGTGS